jgi:uncharacterized protein (TIRG00374 family)
LGLILYLGGGQAWQQVLRADWRYLLAALGITLSWNLLSAYRWALLAERVAGGASAIPLRYYLTFHLIGMLTGQVLPIGVGMLGARPVALHLSRGVSLRRATLSVLLDKLFDPILALLLVGPVALHLIGGLELPVALALMAGTAAAGAAVVGWRYEQGLRLLARLGSRVAGLVAHLPIIGRHLGHRLGENLEQLATESPISGRLAVRAFSLTVTMYLLHSLRLYCISQALRLDIPWHLVLMGACVTQLTLTFSFTPGALGFLEGGWAAVLGLAGLSQAQFLTFVIGRRAFVLIFTALAALLAFAWIGESPARLFRSVVADPRQPEEAGEPRSH